MIELNILGFMSYSIMALVVGFVANYLYARAKNQAAIDDNRAMFYEAIKGENLATKEDIEEITSKVENIKTTLAHTSQSKMISADRQYLILTNSYLSLYNIIEHFFKYDLNVDMDIYEEDRSKLRSHFEATSNVASELRFNASLLFLCNDSKNITKLYYKADSLILKMQGDISDFSCCCTEIFKKYIKDETSNQLEDRRVQAITKVRNQRELFIEELSKIQYLIQNEMKRIIQYNDDLDLESLVVPKTTDV